jgi:hypothetical protein
MRSSFFILTAVCALCAGILGHKAFIAWAQQLDMDREDRMMLEEPFVEESKAEMEGEQHGMQSQKVEFRQSKEIKYIAGKDQKWFTKDDDVYEYYLLYYDNRGRLARRSGYLEGVDSLLMTGDDILDDYIVYEFRPDGKISRETLYSGKGVEQYTGVYAYDADGQKVSIKKYDPQKKEIGSTNYFHGHAGLIIKDVEYKGDEIEKYHVFKYDSKHNAGKVMEFLGAEGGKGKDGVWFTDDDMITSAKQCFYKPDGSKIKEHKYIKPGPDKKWFTKDDVMQYYTLFYY